jgi:antitoxin (DNA-binding transcriptional repressor) of toxin-antitoxin stability system
MHEAKTHLSELVDRASRGDSFIIAKAGKPMVTVTQYIPAQASRRRTGFLNGAGVPCGFDRMDEEKIREMFESMS